MAVIADAFFFPSLDGEQLTVHLQARNTKDHLYPGLSQPVRHFDIGLFIEPGSELHHCGHALAIV